VVTPPNTYLLGKCQGITITPFAAGHTIGGTAWKIRSPSAGTLLYAVNLNHLKERHLDGSVISLSATGGMYEPIARPDLLITDAERTLTISCRRKERDRALLGD
jgi:cleavage and polyadenylation specificity factor subunit 2